MKVSCLLKAMVLLMFMVSCSNPSKKNCEDDVVGDWFYPTILPYDDDTEIVEYSMPKKVGNVDLPQYVDWDTIYFEYSANYKWDNSNLDSIRLLSLVTKCPWNWITFFILKKDGKERLFDSDSDFHDDTSEQIFDELTCQLVIELAPRMLSKVFFLERISNGAESNPFLKDTAGYVRNIVQLVPPHSKCNPPLKSDGKKKADGPVL